MNEKLFYEQTIIVSELLIKASTLETLLLSKGLITKDELESETKNVVSKFTELFNKGFQKADLTTETTEIAETK